MLPVSSSTSLSRVLITSQFYSEMPLIHHYILIWLVLICMFYNKSNSQHSTFPSSVRHFRASSPLKGSGKQPICSQLFRSRGGLWTRWTFGCGLGHRQPCLTAPSSVNQEVRHEQQGWFSWKRFKLISQLHPRHAPVGPSRAHRYATKEPQRLFQLLVRALGS